MSAQADERLQFRVLHRDFLSRVIDVELIAAGGDTRAVVVRFASMLLALSFIFAYLMVPRYATSDWPHARLAFAARNDEEFLLSATIALCGFCAVMAWNAVFPDRRDSLILGLMPVRMRTMLLARFAAIATVLVGAIALLNVFTGLAFPLVLATGAIDAIWSLITWWLTIILAGSFTFCAALVVQGMATQLLPWRTFQQVSGILQLGFLFAVLGFFFLTPVFTDPHPPLYIPSFWFLGLLHTVRGDADPVFAPFAARALSGLAIVAPIAALVYVLSWSRNARRIVEAPEILPAKHSRFGNAVATVLLPAPFDRAIGLFAARTIARSRQHRLMLAIYGGFGFALSLAFSASVLQANRTHAASGAPNIPFMIAGLLLVACSVVGVRAVFALPVALPCSWIFRITAVHRPAAYFAATRKALFALSALPVWIGLGIWYFTIWQGRWAFEHMLLLVLAGIIFVERSLYQFRKIPFACSWLPGGANRSMMAALWALLFLISANAVMSIELFTLQKTARMVMMLGIFAAFAIRSRYRTKGFAADPYNWVQFEDVAPAEIYALDLRQDGAWSGDEAYVEAIDPHFGRSVAARMKPFAAGVAVLLTAGAIYERTGEWRDRRNFPQVGRSWHVGGRSLNIHCTGQGAPTVVFESNIGAPGYGWSFVQRETAAFTRACWYDRAGYGWSDEGPSPNRSDTVANDLHRLLGAAGIRPPYVLVGHAMGGFYVRVFRGRYPDEVAAMVLVDPMSEDLAVGTQSPLDVLQPAIRVGASVAGAVGMFRLVAPESGPPLRGWSTAELTTLAALHWQAKSMVASAREEPLWESGELARVAGRLGDIPVVVLTAGQRDTEEDADLEVERSKKLALHRKMAELSSRGEEVLVEESSHQMPGMAPGAVIAAVRRVVEESRRLGE